MSKLLGNIKSFIGPSRNADMVRGGGRDLCAVLGVATIPQVMEALRIRCNNNGELDNSGIPNFMGLEIGDYIDGINLSGITAPEGGSAPQAWNNTYKNNRIIISGFNFYKAAGDIENSRNHIVFTFNECIAAGRMNPTNVNAGGYLASEARQWLEGANGDGSGAFAIGLKNAIGDYLCTIRKGHGNKDNPAWASYTCFLPSEIEVYGHTILGDDGLDSTRAVMPVIQLPIFRSMEHVTKRRNGSRLTYWLQTAARASSASFCIVSSHGSADYNSANIVNGFSPVFCVA